MVVKEISRKSAEWSIEIGRSSWEEGSSISVRSRHKSRSVSGFSPMSSPEFPAWELPEIVEAVLASDLVPEHLKEKVRAAAAR